MTQLEPAVIPLWGFTKDQERAFHQIRMKRYADDRFTGGGRRGLRLSIDDPVRRVKAYFDPFWALRFNDGIGARGYMMEDLVEVAVMQNPDSVYQGAPYQSQVPIPWGPPEAESESAFDFVLAHPRPVSIKSNDTGRAVEKLKPASANIRQEARMLVEAGYAVGSEWDTWVGSLGQMQARGPFVHTLTQQMHDEYMIERAAVTVAFGYFKTVKDLRRDKVWNDPAEWESRFGLVSTSGAFKFKSLDASGAIEARHKRFMQLRASAKDEARVADEAKEKVYAHAREQIELARLDDPNVKSIRAWSGELIATYTLRKDGAIVVTERPWTEADAAA